MKRIVLFLATFLFSFTLMAQREQEGVIRFLDIPVDGSAYDFARQLKNKDFYPAKNSRGELEYWKGPFNGEDVQLYFDTFRSNLYIVIVAFPKGNKMNVKAQYNQLLNSLLDKDKYLPEDVYEEIPDNVDIGRAIREGNNFKADFLYLSPELFSWQEREMIQRLGKNMMALESEEEQRALAEQFASAMSEALGENASLEDISLMLTRMASIVYGRINLCIQKTGLSYQVMLSYVNHKNAPSNNGSDL